MAERDGGHDRRKPLLEVCVDDPAGLAAAIEGGADRLELCSALTVGGLTPSHGLMAHAAGSPVPVYALIRPRTGDFVFTTDDLSVMVDDVRAARSVGLAGVVIGALRSDGQLDVAALETLVAAAEGMDLTLDRAFDLAADQEEELETAVRLGFSRILTSGGATTAIEGLPRLERLARRAAGRISIMPGAGVRPETVDRLLSLPGVFELHASCSAPIAAADPRLSAFGFSQPGERRTTVEAVRAMKERMLRSVAG
ncbi:copper homeostasis protein CutC [Ciceribacter ferrooxidans]|uniref:PF03932 family protein CutC n=1 Tax=Ciceribacter ferrooxidans TaxID=2509717 RepID=A0A4V1RRQ5_9HYPH|nr:copper homeostasis protein CutC [Ciceribacter ferrooxidans]RYC17274.1 copper homeostasis protein CutC [Ciceribacter ferrooxidans]